MCGYNRYASEMGIIKLRVEQIKNASKTIKVTIQNDKKLYTCTKEILKYRIAGMQMKEIQIGHTLCSPETLKTPLKKSGSSKCTTVSRVRYSQISLIMV